MIKLNKNSPLLQSEEFKRKIIEGFLIFEDEIKDEEDYENEGIEQIDCLLHSVKCTAFGTIQILAALFKEYSGSLIELLKIMGENSEFLVNYFREVLDEELGKQESTENK